jgi:hypothetical protein
MRQSESILSTKKHKFMPALNLTLTSLNKKMRKTQNESMNSSTENRNMDSTIRTSSNAKVDEENRRQRNVYESNAELKFYYTVLQAMKNKHKEVTTVE